MRTYKERLCGYIDHCNSNGVETSPMGWFLWKHGNGYLTCDAFAWMRRKIVAGI